jgi:hypothetical protein
MQEREVQAEAERPFSMSAEETPYYNHGSSAWLQSLIHVATANCADNLATNGHGIMSSQHLWLLCEDPSTVSQGFKL